MKVIDALFNRIYTSKWNPLYQSGALAAFLFIVVSVSGLYLLLFYDITSPHNSVQVIEGQRFAGAWIRSLHRYASDAALVAIAFHALKMFMSGRSWGRRVRAWVTGWVLVFGILFCGWTGLTLVWDNHALWLMQQASRVLDAIPIFTAPLPRIFHVAELPGSFFFSVLFLHVAVPLGLLGLYLVHVSKVARPTHQPPLPIRKFALAALVIVAVLWPLGVQPAADVSALTGRVKVDLFYTGFLPFVSLMPAWAVWASFFTIAVTVTIAIPHFTKKPQESVPPSWVDPERCTGCTQCVQDCPYDAIAMVERTGETADGRRSDLVALVNPDVCVSCGICAGSCAPMGVGPPERTGRDQLGTVKDWLKVEAPKDEMVVIACGNSFPSLPGYHVYTVKCIGSLHTSVIEWLIRKGAAGVFILSCPERDCTNREGPKWSDERIYNDREAELQERVDRRRIRTAHYATTELYKALSDIEEFRLELEELKKPVVEEKPVIELICEETGERIEIKQ